MSVWNAVTIEERIRQFFYVKSSLKDRRFDHLFFTTRSATPDSSSQSWFSASLALPPYLSRAGRTKG